MGFAAHLGVLVNMMDMRSPTDHMTHNFLTKDESLRCFPSAIPLIQHIQKAALFMRDKRSYQNKYPGDAGRALREVTAEMIKRVRAGTTPGGDARSAAVEIGVARSDDGNRSGYRWNPQPKMGRIHTLWLPVGEENRQMHFSSQFQAFSPQIRTSKNELSINVLRALTIKTYRRLYCAIFAARTEIWGESVEDSAGLLILWRKAHFPGRQYWQNFKTFCL